jgi:hypothetical protein
MLRTGFAVSAAVNAALAVSAVALLLGLSSGAGDGEGSAKDWTAYLLSAPFGRWLVGAVGLSVAGPGVGVGVKAWKGTFEERLALNEGARRWVIPMGRLGFFARAVVLLIVGASWRSPPCTPIQVRLRALPVRLERYRRNHPVGFYSVSLLWVCSPLERSSLWSLTIVELMRLSPKRLVERFRAVVGLRRRRLEGERVCNNLSQPPLSLHECFRADSVVVWLLRSPLQG